VDFATVQDSRNTAHSITGTAKQGFNMVGNGLQRNDGNKRKLNDNRDKMNSKKSRPSEDANLHTTSKVCDFLFPGDIYFLKEVPYMASTPSREIRT
jgi:hypothetical protein